MKYYIGIDGGGTKSDGVLIDEKRNVIAQGSGGPTNFLMLGNDPVCETILTLIRTLREKAEIHLNQIEAVFLGTTGAGRRTDAQLLEVDFSKFCVKNNVQIKKFFVDSDAMAALEGAFDGAPGSILIAGTGSIMFGKDAKDILYRVGGFGRFIGDEGSGFSIGKSGLIAVSKHYDGRGEKNLLAKLMEKEYGIASPEDLITRIYKKHFDIAGFAPLVLQAASQGDEISLAILEKESDELLWHIRTMQKKILVKTLDVAFIGSLITNDNIYSQLLRKKIAEKLVDVQVRDAMQSPAFGAGLLAMKRAANGAA